MKKILKSKLTGMLFVVFAVFGIIFAVLPENAYANRNPFAQSESNSPKLTAKELVTTSQSSQEKASQIVNESTKKWQEKIKKEEWLHLVYQINSEVNNGVILPNGEPMPSSYNEDGWYYVNKNGLIEKSVLSLKDEAGNVLQQTVFTEGVEINLTFGFKAENLAPYELKLDRGFLQYIDDAERLKIPIKNKDVKYKNKPYKEFSFTEVYDQPIQFNGDDKEPVKSASVLGLFASETDEMTSYRKTWEYSNGQKVLFEEWKLVLVESMPDAPLDIVAILENIK